MKNEILKKVIPHLVAVVIFLAISLLFCKPVFDGNELNQHDIKSWKGMAQNSFEYKEKHGNFPLWNPNLFGGIPNYQIALDSKTVLPNVVKILSLGMPKPVNFFFLACVCFYILCLSLRAKPVIAIFGAIAFAFATYNPVIIGAGHESKMLAIAVLPLLLAGIINTYEKRYWLGIALTALGTNLEIGVNHLQITYYGFLIIAFITLFYVIDWIKNKEWKHLGISAAITAVSIVVGIATCAMTMMTTAEYTQFTIRGGRDLNIEGDKVSVGKTAGLDTAYAFEYSLGMAEASVVLIPKAFGERSGTSDGRLYALDEDSKVVSKLTERNVPENQAIQVATQLPKYWGGVDGAAGTSGPPYLGAITCLLALIGFVLYKKPLRWGLLAVSVLGIMMAWGKYLPGFNTFLFNNLPFYNKFRAPTMAMVITQVAFPIMAVVTLNFLLFREKSRELLKADFKKILYAIGGLFALLLLMWLMIDYSSPIDKQIIAAYTDNSGSDEMGRLIVSGMKQDRKAMFGGQLLRTVGFIVIVLGALYMYTRNVLKPMVVAIILLLVSTIDLFMIGKEYLNEDNYQTVNTGPVFVATAADNLILSDTTDQKNFRVFNKIGNPYTESRTSYYHKSIGGYHPAKLRNYQDMIERYLSYNINEGVVNMLNARYFIEQNPQSGEPLALRNPNAFGPAWLVKNVKIVEDRVAAIQEIGKTNLRDTAIVEKSFGSFVTQPQWDSAASIRMVKFDNDAIDYEINASSPQFAVFSEVYYPKGWNAYIDGKKVEYCNANYVLRGLSVPAGKHSIRFAFEPATYKKGLNIGFIASFLVVIFFLGGLFMAWKQSRKPSQ